MGRAEVVIFFLTYADKLKDTTTKERKASCDYDGESAWKGQKNLYKYHQMPEVGPWLRNVPVQFNSTNIFQSANIMQGPVI